MCSRRRGGPPAPPPPPPACSRPPGGVARAALVGACDGELTVDQILDALAQLLGGDPLETRTAYVPTVRELVAEGFLEPA